MSRAIIELSFPNPPLNLNQRLHWAKKADITRAIRLEAALKTKPLRKQFEGEPITVRLHWRPRDNRRRDPSNTIATQKPAIDGIVDAGLVPDDTPEYVDELMPRIHKADKALGASCWLEIRRGIEEYE